MVLFSKFSYGSGKINTKVKIDVSKMTSKLYFVRIAKIVINSFSLEILDPFKVHVNIFDIGLYADNKLLKKKVQRQDEKNAQNFSVEIHSVFATFNISRDLSARTSFTHS